MNEYDEESREVDLLEYWKVIVKRKWIIVTFTGALVFFVGVFSFLATPIYRATTTVMIEEEGSRMLSIEDTLGYQNQVYRDLRNFNTQLRLLRSKSLAERVAKKLNLRSRPEFGAGKTKRKSLLASAKDLLTFRWVSSKKNDGEKKPGAVKDPYSDIADAVRGGIQVSPIRETKLVEVSYSSPHPILAADLVNTLAEEFKDFSVEKRYETTRTASDFLDEQIGMLQEELSDKENELQRYSEDKGLVFLSDSEKESTVTSQLADITAAHSTAQVTRINAQAIYEELRNLRVDALPQFVNNTTIQQLNQEYIRKKNEYEGMRQFYREGYPALSTKKAELDDLLEQLQSEIAKSVDAAQREYRTALERERSTKRLLDSQKAEVAKMNKDSITYNSLKIDVENLRGTLNSLSERRNQTQVSARLAGVKTSNISIIDVAEVPESAVSPKKKMNVILAFLIGLFGGVGLCFVLEYLDNTIKGPEDVEKLANLPSLGVIPFLSPESLKKKKKQGYYSYRYKYRYQGEMPEDSGESSMPDIKEIELVNLKYPSFFVSEDYRTVRTSIMLSHADRPPKSLVFTSTLPGEGKTTTAANMAVAFSQLEDRVLIIDADLRKPRMHKIFKTRNVSGLSSYLTGKADLEAVIQETTVDNIWLIPSGPIPPNPSELLNSRKMKELMKEMHKTFGLIILDTPPILAVVDPVIAATLCEGTVFVLQAGKTTNKPFLKAVEELNRSKCKIIGVLFNEAKMNREGYYSSSYQYHYRYHYYGKEERAE